MKIIIVGTAHPYRGGLAAFNERLAREFINQGDEVEIFTFTLQYPSFLFPGKTQFSSEAAPNNLSIKRKINAINPFNWIKIGREIKKRKADKVIFCYWMAFMAPCFGTIAYFVKNKKSNNIALIHNMIPHEPTVLDKILPAYFVRKMDGFLAMTRSVVEDISKFDKHNKPKLVSPHPLYDHYGTAMNREEALSELQLDPSFRYILFFGFIRKYKGLDLLLEAFSDVRMRQFPVKLLIAGEFYEPKEPYLDLIKEKSLSDNVIIHSDFIPDEKVKFYFNAADLITQTYRSATQSGVSQIAYNFEKPMLVTNVGGLSETIPHGKVGYVIEPKKDEIANALVDFFENDKIELFVENVRLEKKKYEWNKMIDTIKKI
jgi:glycosyltransferase involved in cell wall biosynthesis